MYEWNLTDFLYQQLGWYGLFLVFGIVLGFFLAWRPKDKKGVRHEKSGVRRPLYGVDGVYDGTEGGEND